MQEIMANVQCNLVPYADFTSSEEFDFDETIFDLNSKIDLLSSHADSLDYIVAVASASPAVCLIFFGLENLT